MTSNDDRDGGCRIPSKVVFQSPQKCDVIHEQPLTLVHSRGGILLVETLCEHTWGGFRQRISENEGYEHPKESPAETG